MSPNQSYQSPLEVAHVHKLLDELATEVDRQDRRFGQHDDAHGPFGWFAILGEEFGEVAREVTTRLPPRGREENAENYRQELLQLAAVALRMLAAHDRETHRG